MTFHAAHTCTIYSDKEGVIKECTIVRIPNIFSRVSTPNNKGVLESRRDGPTLLNVYDMILADFLGPGVSTWTF